MPKWAWPRTRQLASTPAKEFGTGPPPGKGRSGRGNRGGGSGGAGGAVPLIATGSYVGDGIDGRTITTPFAPQFVIVKRVLIGRIGVIRTSNMAGDVTKVITSSTGFGANDIQSIVATGFTVGTDTEVNLAGSTYVYVAVAAGTSNAFQVGTYVGDGISGKQISVNFQPDNVIVFQAGAVKVIWRTSDFAATESETFDAVNSTTGILAFNGSGFTVGTAAEVNTNLTTYYFVAFKNQPGVHAIAAWAGNGVDARNITTFGFTPSVVIVKRNNSTTVGIIRHASGPAGDVSQQLDGVNGDVANRIQALIANGIELGTDASVNAAGSDYKSFALRATV